MKKPNVVIREVRDVIDMETPTIGPITEKTKEINKGRWKTKKVYRDEEFNARRERIGKLELPLRRENGKN